MAELNTYHYKVVVEFEVTAKNKSIADEIANSIDLSLLSVKDIDYNVYMNDPEFVEY